MKVAFLNGSRMKLGLCRDNCLCESRETPIKLNLKEIFIFDQTILQADCRGILYINLALYSQNSQNSSTLNSLEEFGILKNCLGET